MAQVTINYENKGEETLSGVAREATPRTMGVWESRAYQTKEKGLDIYL